MLTIHEFQLPAPEADVRAALAAYKAALEAHSTTVGVPAPFPEYEVLRAILATGGDFTVIPAVVPPMPPVLTPNDQIDAQINEIERNALAPRKVREIVMDHAVDMASKQTPPLTEAELYAADIGYRRLKDLDEQIKALRAQKTP